MKSEKYTKITFDKDIKNENIEILYFTKSNLSLMISIHQADTLTDTIGINDKGVHQQRKKSQMVGHFL